MSTRRPSLRFRWILALALAGTAAGAARASEAGQAAADEVSGASYADFLDLYLYTHAGDDRGFGAEHDLARNNIQTLMQGYGLTVTLEPFVYSSATYYNVVGTKLGTLFPDQEYIIGAHYDSVGNPGADDNASGVALVLEAARILTRYDSAYTIRFVAFDREEQGLIGSNAYVDAHWNDTILGMVSADMVAYDPGTNNCNVYGRTASDPIKASLAAAIAEYGQGLTGSIGGDTPYSDHAPFEAEGFQACLLIEGEVWNNPYYHTQQDNFETPGNLNFDYAVRMVRSVVGWLVDQADIDVTVDALQFTFPAGRPEFVYPRGGTRLRVEVSGLGAAVPQPDTGLLHVDRGNGWETLPLESLAPNVYDAVFPAAPCGSEVWYYLSAQEAGGAVFTSPRQAPAVAYRATAAYGEQVVFADDFETDQGWTTANLGATSGFWQRGVPVNDPNWAYDPAADADGSGRCWLTQNQLGNTDVDDGAVRLTSPPIDMSAGQVRIRYDYYLYLTNTDGAVDRLLVEVNNTGGSGPWFELVRHTTSGGLSWRSQELATADLLAAGVTPTATMLLRFTANDADPQSIVEAGLDGFRVTALVCEPPLLKGDLNCDLHVDFRDIDPFVVALSGQGPYEALFPDCDWLNADCDGDGAVTFDDIDAFVPLLGG